MNWLISLIILFFCSFNGIASSQNQAKFISANKLYNAGQYDTSLLNYEHLIEEGVFSFELYFNAGNAAYHLKKIGKSILYFEKAKKLDPSNEDVIHNLMLLNKLILDKNTAVNKSKAYDRMMSALSRSPNYWSWSAIFLSIISMVCFVLYQLSRSKRNQKIGFVLGSLSLVLSVFVLILAIVQFNYINTINSGVVLNPSVTLKIAPNNDTSSAFILHEGSKVELKSSVDDWYEVIYSDGKIGWLNKDELGLI
ncbi:MAG: tetratricopeptide repeat protein [Crocinitomicaceae bacterium]|nr:tetratricopeptide repeat protein [Crocinitomicaceae bacterium]